MFDVQPSAQQVESRLAQFEKKLDTMRHKTGEQEKNMTVALGTSKINYMDPRISVAWCKRNEMPIEKIYSATQREKFPWAMSVDHTFQF
jgi:DNA topoisomerase-1